MSDIEQILEDVTPVEIDSKPMWLSLVHSKRGAFSVSGIALGFAQFFISLLFIFTVYFFGVIVVGNVGNLVNWVLHGFKTGGFDTYTAEDAVLTINAIFSIMKPAILWTLYICEFWMYYILVLFRIVPPTFDKPTVPVY